MARNIRNFKKLRHWKQRFHKDAGFIWRRPRTYGSKDYKPGDPIPKELEENPTKLRRFWEAGVIELADFSAPNVATGQVDDSSEVPEGVTITPGKGSWSVVTTADGEEHKVNGKKALEILLVDLKEKADKDKDGDSQDGDDAGSAENGGATDGNAADDDDWLNEGNSVEGTKSPSNEVPT